MRPAIPILLRFSGSYSLLAIVSIVVCGVVMVQIVAEVGCNHKGDMGIAKEMIRVATQTCRANYVKFQKRTNKELLTAEEYGSPHPNPENSYGPTYGEHREFLEFNLDQHAQLMRWCEELGTKYATSVWDVTAAKEIATLNPDFIKVPSACNLDFDLLETLIDGFSGDIHVSTGMTSAMELEEVFKFIERRGAAGRTVFYACTSGYPVAFDEVCILEIQKLRAKYGASLKDIGFSGHHLGIAIDIGAVTLGANWIERHFTLDRTWRGTDHAASLEPSGLTRLVRDVRALELALRFKEKDILDVEVSQRRKLKRNGTHVDHARRIRSAHTS